MAAAGGYGPPFERDVEAVAEDVRQGKMTAEHARREYGVVFTARSYEVDTDATRQIRGLSA
jgi:N-methylhydantoinase B